MSPRLRVATLSTALGLAALACDGYRANYRLAVDYISQDEDGGYFGCTTWYALSPVKPDAGPELMAGPPGNSPKTLRVVAACPQPWREGQVEYVRITPDLDAGSGYAVTCRLCPEDWHDVAKVEACVLPSSAGCP